jgi:hypothetical protein
MPLGYVVFAIAAVEYRFDRFLYLQFDIMIP